MFTKYQIFNRKQYENKFIGGKLNTTYFLYTICNLFRNNVTNQV